MAELPSLSDPQWFPLGYRVAEDAVVFARNTAQALGDAAFLDERADIGWDRGVALPAADVIAGIDRATAPAWLFHTAFCASTLLARTLHAPPAAVALKEPRALLELSHAALRPDVLDDARLSARLAAVVALLGRPWAAGGHVLVKPTNQVNRVLPHLLRASPRSRAILLYSSLDEFVLSCCKKLPEADTRVRWMAQHLLVGSRLQATLGVPALHPFAFVESCVLTWYAQIERYADALAADSDDRLRTLDMRDLMREREATVRACATWLQLDGALPGLGERVRTEFARDAKTTTRAFSPEQREAEKKAVRAHYQPLVDAAREWAAAVVAPAATLPRDWKALVIA